MTAPDPKTVREIARDALVVAVRRGATEAVEVALIAHGGGGPVVGEKFDAYTNAVAAEYDRMAAALARPNEQQCGSHVHPDFVGDQKIRCELPDGHFWHRNGERTWTS